MDHHTVAHSSWNNPRKLRHTATLPTIADRCRAVARHLFVLSSAAANISHAVPAMHKVSMCKPAQPLIAVKLKATRQLTLINEHASAHGEPGLKQIEVGVGGCRLIHLH